MIDVGTSIGNYVVKAKLGEGGMGLVWLAEHPLIGKKVAIKVIHPTYAKNPEAVSRFFTEAQAVNRIGHPNIVDITDFGQTPDGASYFVMEFLAGESLSERLTGGGFDLRRALHVTVQTADALAASHAAGILHRDLKPDNLFLVRRGQDPDVVKVLDFGLAKLTAADGQVQHKTRTGSMMGTPYYMAPEQCAGKADIDARADIYSLGVILFEMVTGRVPFPGEGYAEIIVGHMTQPAPRVREVSPSAPEWLDALVDRCLAKDRNERVQTMAELRDQLVGQLEQLPGGAPLPRAGTGTGVVSAVPGSWPPGTTPPAGVKPISTMSLAAAEAAAPVDADGGRKRTMLIAAGAGVLGLGVVAALLLGGSGKHDAPVAVAGAVDAAVVAAAPPDAAPEVVAAQADAAPPPAATVDIEIGGQPDGVTVTAADGTVVCAATPCTWTTNKSKSPVLLTFAKPGYVTRVEKITPTRSQAVNKDLVVDRTAGKPTRPLKPMPTTPDKPKEPDKPGDSDSLLKPSF